MIQYVYKKGKESIMNDKINIKELLNSTKDKKLYYYLAYSMEKDENKKMLVLEKIQELKEKGEI